MSGYRINLSLATKGRVIYSAVAGKDLYTVYSHHNVLMMTHFLSVILYILVCNSCSSNECLKPG